MFLVEEGLNTHTLARERRFLKHANGKPKVGVVADERLPVGQVIHSVEQHVDGDVDIESLLFSAKDIDDSRAVEERHPVGVGHELAAG